jgi:hypothetical protein
VPVVRTTCAPGQKLWAAFFSFFSLSLVSTTAELETLEGREDPKSLHAWCCLMWFHALWGWLIFSTSGLYGGSPWWLLFAHTSDVGDISCSPSHC